MFCAHCGKEVSNEAVVCVNCGCLVERPRQQAPVIKPSGLKIAAKVLMIISTVIMGFWIFPLLWTVPMVCSYSGKLERGEPISIEFKICTLVFVNLIAGILLLCDKD